MDILIVEREARKILSQVSAALLVTRSHFPSNFGRNKAFPCRLLLYETASQTRRIGHSSHPSPHLRNHNRATIPIRHENWVRVRLRRQRRRHIPLLTSHPPVPITQQQTPLREEQRTSTITPRNTRHAALVRTPRRRKAKHYIGALRSVGYHHAIDRAHDIIGTTCGVRGGTRRFDRYDRK
jgi:hypothetical protein